MGKNHPNRNWRARASAAFMEWLKKQEEAAQVFYKGSGWDVIEKAYVAGFEAGRASTQRRPENRQEKKCESGH